MLSCSLKIINKLDTKEKKEKQKKKETVKRVATTLLSLGNLDLSLQQGKFDLDVEQLPLGFFVETLQAS